MMSRRNVLKKLLASSAIVATPISPGFIEAVLARPADHKLEVLSKGHANFVAALADIVIPATQSPSATDVGVVEFIDFMLGHWYTASEVSEFIAGLDDAIEERADQTMLGFVSDLDKQSFDTDMEPEPRHRFYRRAKELVLIGYFTSKDGAQESLGVVGPVGEHSFESSGAPGAPIRY